MSHKCVAQQVVAYESLKTKETTSWYFPKVVAVAYGCRERSLMKAFNYRV